LDFLSDPWTWWIEPFTTNVFMRNACGPACWWCCAPRCGHLGGAAGMSFLGDALAHGVLPGIAIAFVLGFSTTVGVRGRAGDGRRHQPDPLALTMPDGHLDRRAVRGFLALPW